MAEQSARASGPDEGAFAPAYSFYVLGVLFLVYIVNFIDRQVLSVMLEQVKADLQVSDTAMGFLSGFAFALFYTFAGIPIARYADRANRRNVIAVGLVVWSAFTAVSGLSRHFWHMALARVGVGVGEAAGSPPAHSLISDYFPLRLRATALSVYGGGVYLGVGAAYIFGAEIAASFGWRVVYYVLGLAGLPLAVVLLTTVREAPRGRFDFAPRMTTVQPPLGESLRIFLRNRSLMLIIAGTAVQSLQGYAILGWAPTFLTRVHGMTYTEAAWPLGLSIALLGLAGSVLGGRIADWSGRKDARWYMRLPAIEALVLLPFGAGFLLLDDPNRALWYFGPFYFLGAMYLGPMFAMTQTLVAPNLRATASAVNLFIVNMVGLGLGPLVVGMLNDYFMAQQGVMGIRSSMLVVLAIGGFSAILFWLASLRLPGDLAAARADSAGA